MQLMREKAVLFLLLRMLYLSSWCQVLLWDAGSVCTLQPNAIEQLLFNAAWLALAPFYPVR